MGSVKGFFSQNAIVGKLLTQPRYDDFICESVSLRDRFAIIGTGFLLDLQRTFVEIEDRRARLARELEGDAQLVIVSRSVSRYRIHSRVHSYSSEFKL